GPQCRCATLLPPPGTAVEQRAEHCVECGFRLPALLPGGERPSPVCPGPRCGSTLPPPAPSSTWVSEYCLACGTRLRQSALSRHRDTNGCRICGCDLPLSTLALSP